MTAFARNAEQFQMALEVAIEEGGGSDELTLGIDTVEALAGVANIGEQQLFFTGDINDSPYIPAVVCYTLNSVGVVTEYPIATGCVNERLGANVSGMAEGIALNAQNRSVFGASNSLAKQMNDRSVLRNIYCDIGDAQGRDVLIGGFMLARTGEAQTRELGEFVPIRVLEHFQDRLRSVGLYDRLPDYNVYPERIDSSASRHVYEVFRDLTKGFSRTEALEMMVARDVISFAFDEAVQQQGGAIKTPVLLRPSFE